MSFQSWLKALQAIIGGKPSPPIARRQDRKASRICLRLEQLEDRLAPSVNTTTALVALVNGSSVATTVYGTSVTLAATVIPVSGSIAPGAGFVDFQDGAIDLGVISTETVSGSNAIFTLVTTPTQLQVIQGSGGVHTIAAVYSPSTGFNGSTGTLQGGEKVTPAPLTITAVTNTKVYDSTTAAAAVPMVSGLMGADSVTGLSERYSTSNATSQIPLSVYSNLTPLSPSSTLGGLNFPVAVAVDGHVTVYVANQIGNSVSEFIPGQSTPTATITGLNIPTALALDNGGNLYVANQAQAR